MKMLHIDDAGVCTGEAAEDAIGEICIQGPHVFPGYKDIPRDKVFVKGPDGEEWLRSGDLGRVDPDGYFWITGRAKDLIIRGGHNIDPGMIEEAIMMHPKVAFVGVIGQPDAYAGELPCAYVELNEGETVTADEIVAFAKEHVSERAAQPVYAEVMTELPKTAVGKIFKPELRQSAICRVYTDALTKAGISADITCEKDDKKGVVAVVSTGDDVPEADLAKVLDTFAISWKKNAA